ncbi:MAG: hypothetical protein AAGA47_04785 [Pseudomonadota bacterium]
MELSSVDPKGLIRESYQIDGITGGECRSIFLDWAINVPAGQDTLGHVRFLLGVYGAEAPGHPMTETLKAALDEPPATGRRGGRRARVPQE